jgi:hypothetical protein
MCESTGNGDGGQDGDQCVSLRTLEQLALGHGKSYDQGSGARASTLGLHRSATAVRV